jgi:hypothetical protein
MAAIAVQCEGSRERGWSCSVTLREGGIDISNHHVRVWQSDLQRLAPTASDPSALVKASFKFLLERESPHMILRTFELSDITRHFPEYEAAIRRQGHRSGA